MKDSGLGTRRFVIFHVFRHGHGIQLQTPVVFGVALTLSVYWVLLIVKFPSGSGGKLVSEA